MTRSFLFVLSLVMFALAFMCADASANGGAVVAAVRRPILSAIVRPRVVVAPLRQAVVVAPQAVVVQPFIRQRFVAPLVVPQAFVAPQALYVQPQAFFQQQYVVPQVQAFSTGCASSAFFSY